MEMDRGPERNDPAFNRVLIMLHLMNSFGMIESEVPTYRIGQRPSATTPLLLV